MGFVREKPMSRFIPLPAVGPYAVLERLGHGSMGTVYKARHKTSGDEVAVKIANDRVMQHPTLGRRFRNEYQVASKMAHANLVRALDYGVEQGVPYLVMELVAGQNLDQRLKTKGPLNQAEAGTIFLAVVLALQF